MKKKILKVLGVLVITAVVLVSARFIVSSRGTAADITRAEKGDIKEYIEDIGTVKCEDTMAVSIEGNGLIRSLYTEVGNRVKKGERLLSMDTRQLEIQLQEADKKIKEIEASLAGSEIKNYATWVEKAGIAVEQAEIAYQTASNDVDTARSLAEMGAITREELNRKETALKQAQAALSTARLNLQEIENNTPESIESVYAAQLEQVALSRERLADSLKKQVVTAPMDGIILEKNVEINTMGVAGTVAFVIGNTESMEIEAYILADDVPEIMLEDEVEIIERSGNKNVISGKVVKIAPAAVNITSSLGINQKKVAVTIELQEDAASFKPGYEVDVRVITDRQNDVLLVPLSAVFDYEGKSCVFVVEEGRAVLRTIKKGIQDDNFVAVMDGIKEGEPVLSAPDIDIKEGMQIKNEALQ